MAKLQQHQQKGGTGGTLAALYALIIVVLGLGLPLTHFLSTSTTTSGLYLSIFHIYIYGVSLLFLFYVQICLCRNRRRDESDDDKSSVEMEYSNKKVDDDLESFDRCEDNHNNISPHKTANAESPGGGEDDDKSQLTVDEDADDVPKFSDTADGVNFFLRLGAIVFGMGSVILDGFRLLSYIEGRASWDKCYGQFFVVHTIMRLVFVFSETFFIFKNHRLIMNHQVPVMQWGMLHMVATNISMWSMTVVLETAESYLHYLQAGIPYITADGTLSPTPSRPYVMVGPTIIQLSNKSGICHIERNMADKAAPYLYPCAIQFSLIAAAAMYKIFTNIGKDVSMESKPKWHLGRGTSVCHKANTGLFLGLFLLACTCISACFFLLYPGQIPPMLKPATMLVYVITDITLLAVCFISVIAAFWRLSKLERCKEHNSFNKNLLFVSLVGYYSLLVFIMVPSVMLFKGNSQGKAKIFAMFQLVICILSFVQSTAQVALVTDGLRRCAGHRHQARSKPGRSLLTFLLIANISMWVVNAFEVQELHTSGVMRMFYGELSWQIIIHLCLPLVIFFRFHSAVCLSDIWLNAYRVEYNKKGKLISHKTFDSENFL